MANMTEKMQSYQETVAALRRDLVEAEAQVKQLREAIAAMERLVTPQQEIFPATARTIRFRLQAARNGLSGLSMIDAAQKVLADAGRPLHIMEIVDELLSRGFPYEKHPSALRASLTGSLERKDTFRRVAKATYGLSVWPQSEKQSAETKADAAE